MPGGIAGSTLTGLPQHGTREIRSSGIVVVDEGAPATAEAGGAKAAAASDSATSAPEAQAPTANRRPARGASPPLPPRLPTLPSDRPGSVPVSLRSRCAFAAEDGIRGKGGIAWPRGSVFPDPAVSLRQARQEQSNENWRESQPPISSGLKWPVNWPSIQSRTDSGWSWEFVEGRPAQLLAGRVGLSPGDGQHQAVGMFGGLVDGQRGALRAAEGGHEANEELRPVRQPGQVRACACSSSRSSWSDTGR